MKKMVCELCDGSDFIKQDGFFVCQSCGCKYSIEEAKKMMRDDDSDVIKVTSETRVSQEVQSKAAVPVTSANHEFESKLATADNWADIYFRNGYKSAKNGLLVGFDAVWKYYADAEVAGANESRVYLHMARFLIKAMPLEIAANRKYIKDRKKLIDGYATVMDFAIKNAPESQRGEIEEEKRKGLIEYEEAISPYKERKGFFAALKKK